MATRTSGGSSQSIPSRWVVPGTAQASTTSTATGRHGRRGGTGAAATGAVTRLGDSNVVAIAVANGRGPGQDTAFPILYSPVSPSVRYLRWTLLWALGVAAFLALCGAWAATGPTAPHSPLTSWSTIPTPGFYTDNAVQHLKSKGVSASKLLIGIGFYGRGWTGVTQAAPGGSASGPAPGTYEQGIEDYHVLVNSCPANGTVAGTAYCFRNGQWWSYDTPGTISGKMSYAKSQGLAGSFFWELSGDTSNGSLIAAMKSGLG